MASVEKLWDRFLKLFDPFLDCFDSLLGRKKCSKKSVVRCGAVMPFADVVHASFPDMPASYPQQETPAVSPSVRGSFSGERDIRCVSRQPSASPAFVLSPFFLIPDPDFPPALCPFPRVREWRSFVVSVDGMVPFSDQRPEVVPPVYSPFVRSPDLAPPSYHFSPVAPCVEDPVAPCIEDRLPYAPPSSPRWTR